jgi:hypothetical protein
MGRFRRFKVILVMAIAVLCSNATVGTATAPAVRPQVVCLTEWGEHPEGAYRIRPHSCDLHERGKFPVAHLNVMVTHNLHWLHWGQVAVARGQLGISTYGWAPLKLRLTQPRELCGHTVFTKARLLIRIRSSSGHWHRSHTRIQLDNCLS